MRLEKVKTNAHGGWDVFVKEYDSGSDAFYKRDIQDLQQEPTDEQLEALAELKSIYIEVCELPKEWADGIDITGFTISWQKNEHMKITISGVRHLSNGTVVNIASPLRNVTAEKEGATNVLTTGQATLIETAMNAALDYFRGTRKEDAKAVAHRTAYAKGQQAFKDGKTLFDNEFNDEEHGEDATKSWIQGFTDANGRESDCDESAGEAISEEDGEAAV